MRYLNRKLAITILLLAAMSGAFPDFAFAGSRVDHEELLQENIAKWDKSGIVAYEFDIRLSCFCGDDPSNFLHFAVFGSTATITEIESGRIVTEDDISDRPVGQIPKLFYMIPRILADDPASFRVDYDEKYGFPIAILFDATANGSDDEFGILVSNFRIISKSVRGN